MTPTNWTPIFKKYRGKWVALAEDEKTVIASGKTPKEVFEKARQEGHAKPILAKLPNSLTSYVGSGYEVPI